MVGDLAESPQLLLLHVSPFVGSSERTLVLKVSESRRILGGRQTASSTIHTLGADTLDLDPDSGM